MCACICVCVSACVHMHKGKLLSTSNRGPNQHPIAHPHNLSLYPSLSLFCSSYFHSLSAFFRPPPPRLLPWDGSSSRGGEGGKMGVGGRGGEGAPGNGGHSASSALRSAECFPLSWWWCWRVKTSRGDPGSGSPGSRRWQGRWRMLWRCWNIKANGMVTLWACVCACVCRREGMSLISCSYLNWSGVNKVEWRWIMHYTLNNGTEERAWAGIDQNL